MYPSIIFFQGTNYIIYSEHKKILLELIKLSLILNFYKVIGKKKKKLPQHNTAHNPNIPMNLFYTSELWED